ncbi:hypothetical protein FKW77_009519 [Venturia effusa]|uniref:HpcH/HpaI aldolase/citrate lyase domain-containing protein n=1 Tax=Venturia effusa TaxID=50376 RepID=A0A517L049_9PEZI|nr:hypothetical protein FKW77_009519 [Venturia effusa]
MQASNYLSNALQEKRPAFGAWQSADGTVAKMIPGPNVSRQLARCGFEWILIDMEHGNIDDAAMHDAVAAIGACGVSPIVRIAANEGWMVKRALDAGAHGILVPLLRTAEEAASLVASAKFPPMGIRGFGSPFPYGNFGNVSAADYLEQANSSLLTCVQIETQEALDNVDAIAKVPGVDVLFVGPFDLGNNIGHVIKNGKMDPELETAIQTIRKAAEANGKGSGIYCTSGEQAKRFADEGFHMISAVTDMAILPAASTAALQVAKGMSGAPKVATGPYGG